MFWLISVPPVYNDEDGKALNKRSGPRDRVTIIRTYLASQVLSITTIKYPRSLKTGMVKDLIEVSESLAKLNSYAEGLVNKVGAAFLDLTLHEPFLDEDSAVSTSKSQRQKAAKRPKDPLQLFKIFRDDEEESVYDYTENWEWSDTFSLNKSPKEHAEDFLLRLRRYEDEYKKFNRRYAKTVSDLTRHEKKKLGSLLTMNLEILLEDRFYYVSGDNYDESTNPVPFKLYDDPTVVPKRIREERKNYHKLQKKAKNSKLKDKIDNSDLKKLCYLDTVNLMTVFIVVRSYMEEDFVAKYMHFSDGVLPDSIQFVMSDDQNALYTVVLMRSSYNEFVSACKEKGLTVRTAEWREATTGELADEEENRVSWEEERLNLFTKMKREWDRLRKWCEFGFSEIYVIMMHIKVLDCFINSVRRFGLPVDYILLLLRLDAKSKIPKIESTLRLACEDIELPDFDSVLTVDKKGKKKNKKQTFNEDDVLPYIKQVIRFKFKY